MCAYVRVCVRARACACVHKHVCLCAPAAAANPQVYAHRPGPVCGWWVLTDRFCGWLWGVAAACLDIRFPCTNTNTRTRTHKHECTHTRACACTHAHSHREPLGAPSPVLHQPSGCWVRLQHSLKQLPLSNVPIRIDADQRAVVLQEGLRECSELQLHARHTNTPTHRYTDTQTHRHTDTQTHRHTDTQDTHQNKAEHKAINQQRWGHCVNSCFLLLACAKTSMKITKPTAME